MIFAPCLAAALLDGAAPDQPRLGGGLIQHWTEFKTGGMDAAKWRNVLDAMRKAKLRIIVQRTVEDDVSFVPERGEFLDSTEIVLRYSEMHDMEACVGLKDDSLWNDLWWNELFLAELASENSSLARVIQHRYGRNRAFRGWYIPQEM